MCKLTNRNLDEKWKPEASIEELLEVVGIKIGMSYSRMKNMRDYWKKLLWGVTVIVAELLVEIDVRKLEDLLVSVVITKSEVNHI